MRDTRWNTVAVAVAMVAIVAALSCSVGEATSVRSLAMRHHQQAHGALEAHALLQSQSLATTAFGLFFPRSLKRGAAGVAGRAGPKGQAGASGRKGGDASANGGASGRKGGDAAGDGGASGRKGGDTASDAGASGRKGGDVGVIGGASGRKGGGDLPTSPFLTNGGLSPAPTNADIFRLVAGGPRQVPATVFLRNQGAAETCWAHSALTLLELRMQVALAGSEFTGWLSIDQVIRCVKNEGVGGGNPLDALAFLMQYKYQLDSDIRAGKPIDCKTQYPKNAQGKRTMGYQPILVLQPCIKEGEDCRRMAKYEPTMEFKLQLSPFLTYVDASRWANYAPKFVKGKTPTDYGAVAYPASQCSMDPKDGDHLIILTDVVTDPRTGKKYWRGLNSWSTDWGVDGFIYLEYGVNACGLANYPVGLSVNSGNWEFDPRRAGLLAPSDMYFEDALATPEAKEMAKLQGLDITTLKGMRTPLIPSTTTFNPSKVMSSLLAYNGIAQRLAADPRPDPYAPPNLFIWAQVDAQWNILAGGVSKAADALGVLNGAHQRDSAYLQWLKREVHIQPPDAKQRAIFASYHIPQTWPYVLFTPSGGIQTDTIALEYVQKALALAPKVTAPTVTVAPPAVRSSAPAAASVTRKPNAPPPVNSKKKKAIASKRK